MSQASNATGACSAKPITNVVSCHAPAGKAPS